LAIAGRASRLKERGEAETTENLTSKVIDARGELIVLEHLIAVRVGLRDEAIEGGAALRGGLEAFHRAVLAHVPAAKHHVEHGARALRGGGFRVVACSRNCGRRSFRRGIDLLDRLVRRRRRGLLRRGSKRRGERQRETQELRLMAQRETDSHLLFPNQTKGTRVGERCAAARQRHFLGRRLNAHSHLTQENPLGFARYPAMRIERLNPGANASDSQERGLDFATLLSRGLIVSRQLFSRAVNLQER